MEEVEFWLPGSICRLCHVCALLIFCINSEDAIDMMLALVVANSYSTSPPLLLLDVEFRMCSRTNVWEKFGSSVLVAIKIPQTLHVPF